MEDWKYPDTSSGTPQGGLVSPLRAHSDLHERDCSVETRMADCKRGQKRSITRVENVMRPRAQGRNTPIEQHDDAEEKDKLLDPKKGLQRQMLELPRPDPYDPQYRKVRDCRSAADVVLGARCPKNEAEEISGKIATFLREQLRLNISPAKSGIKHTSEVIRFLGYDSTIVRTEKIVKGNVSAQQ